MKIFYNQYHTLLIIYFKLYLMNLGLMQKEIENDHEEIVAYSGKPENGEKPFQKGFQGSIKIIGA